MEREKGDPTDEQDASCLSTLLVTFLSVYNPVFIFASHTLIVSLFGSGVADFPFLREVVSAVLGVCSFRIAVAVLLLALRGRCDRVRHRAIYAAFAGYLCLSVSLVVWVVISFAHRPPL